MNSITELPPSAYRKAADLREKILALEKELQELLGTSAQAELRGTEATGMKGDRRKGRMRRPGGARAKRSSNGITTNAAILKALEGGKLDVPSIVSKVTNLKGKASKASILQALVVLKKKGQITNPERGHYVIKR